MNNKCWLIALAAAAAFPVAVQAQDTGNFLVRARATNLDSANKDSTPLGLTINDKTFLEVDFSYFFSPNFAAELVLTYPQKQRVYSNGGEIGSFKHLPPTLLAQYHFTGLGGFRPYVGAGVNYTNISAVRFTPGVAAALSPGLKHNSFGLAVQVGVDVPVGGGWLINLDAKKVQIGTTVYSFGNSVGKFKVDPVLLSVGVGKRF
ncbi:OmpW family protein [Ideonella sp. A 288]|uniref:OmpW/AlkL family protein n=1 Tax=Ideonella sp. A 288 TaxID=1962181 RepID=UPI000B4AC73C|nr:OmpW family outer membrane protein [Ideonella sp. A 288]